jgi:ubiquinone/menaquinone biosynthesis C-methylase UbiE
MEQEITIENKENPSIEAWNKFSFAYYSAINRSSIQMMSILMALSRLNRRSKILDAGCGPGLGTKLLTIDIPNYNSCIYAIDYSDEMIALSSAVFNDYEDFKANHHNHWQVVKDRQQDKIELDKDLEQLRNSGKIGKIVKFLQGNVENLTFEDSQFDLYISNFCLMLCHDVDKAIHEMYRVLKAGGVAALSIWGKKEESKLGYLLFEKIFKKFGVDDPQQNNFGFALADNPDALIQKFLKAGFKEVRIEYSNVIYDCYDEQDFLIKFQGPKINNILKSLKNEEKVKEILENVKDEAKKHVVENKEMPTLNTMIILAFK